MWKQIERSNFKPVSMIIDYLECRADLNFEVDFGSNGAIGSVAT